MKKISHLLTKRKHTCSNLFTLIHVHTQESSSGTVTESHFFIIEGFSPSSLSSISFIHTRAHSFSSFIYPYPSPFFSRYFVPCALGRSESRRKTLIGLSHTFRFRLPNNNNNKTRIAVYYSFVNFMTNNLQIALFINISKQRQKIQSSQVQS